jgi:NitT/TauT family transport system ATP-binding protein
VSQAGVPASRSFQPIPGDVQIQCDHVSKVFRDADGSEVVALVDFRLEIRNGELITILGPSGCGKSTLLNILAGFEQPTAGEVRLDGQVVSRPGPDRGVVFQDYALFPWLNVRQNIEVGLRERRMSQDERGRVCRRYVDLVGLNGFEKRHPHQLSGGMQQRVAIARALAIEPKTLLMDEPFGSLDAQTRRLLQGELLRAWEATHKTIVFVTHSVEEAIFLGQRIAIMTARPGRIKELIKIDLPYPRDVAGGEFNVYRRQAEKLIEYEVFRTLKAGAEL